MSRRSQRARLRAIARELKRNPPRVLLRTLRKYGRERAERQRRAILLAKARRAGLRV